MQSTSQAQLRARTNSQESRRSPCTATHRPSSQGGVSEVAPDLLQCSGARRHWRTALSRSSGMTAARPRMRACARPRGRTGRIQAQQSGVRVPGVKDHAHRAILNFGGKLLALPHDGSILNRRSLLKTRTWTPPFAKLSFHDGLMGKDCTRTFGLFLGNAVHGDFHVSYLERAIVREKSNVCCVAAISDDNPASAGLALRRIEGVPATT